FVCNKNVYVVRAKNGTDAWSLLALLNSQLVSYLYLSQVPQADKDDFPQVTIRDLLRIPLAKLVVDGSAMTALRRLGHRLTSQSRAPQTGASNSTLLGLEAELDDTVGALFDLSTDEKELLERHARDTRETRKMPRRLHAPASTEHVDVQESGTFKV